MTFDEWVKDNDITIANEIVRERMRWAWDAATQAERLRCSKVSENWHRPIDELWVGSDRARIAAEILKG